MKESEWKWISGLLLCLACVCSAERTEHVEFDASGLMIADPSLPSVSHWMGTSPEGVTFSANKAAYK